MAVYPFEDGPLSDGVNPFLPLETMNPPTGSMYVNATDRQTGYTTLKWDTVPEAVGYKNSDLELFEEKRDISIILVEKLGKFLYVSNEILIMSLV